MASREKKQIASKQLTSKKEWPLSDKSTENIGGTAGKSVTCEKKEPIKKPTNLKQGTVKKNSRQSRSNYVNVANDDKLNKHLSLKDKSLQSSVISKCKPIAKKQTGSDNTKSKQNTKDLSDLQSNVNSNLGDTKKCKTNVTTNCKVMGNLKSKNSMENVVNQDSKDLLGLDEATFVNQLFTTSVSQKQTQNTKLKKKYKKQISSSGLDACNGIRSRATPYLTRSDSPIRVLRNGKRRKLRDPSMFDGLDSIEPAKKRRRIASITKDEVVESDSSMYESLPAQVESHNSRCFDGDVASVPSKEEHEDASKSEHHHDTKNAELRCESAFVQNVKVNGRCIQDVHDNVVAEGTLCLGAQSIKCSSNNTAAALADGSHDSHVKKVDVCGEYNLGKTISNRIAALIKRSKISEARVGSGSDDEGSVTKQEMQLCDNSAVFDFSQKLMDRNSNLCDSSDVGKPCTPAGGVAASIACSKDKVSSVSNVGTAAGELGGSSSHSSDSADIKLGQFPSDGAINVSDGGSLLELNFSEVRAAISKKIQNCAKESVSDSVMYKDNLTIGEITCSFSSEPLAPSKKSNSSISFDSAGAMLNVSEMCKNSCFGGKPVVGSTQLSQTNKVKGCKRVLDKSGENKPNTSTKKIKLQKKPAHTIQKLQIPQHKKGSLVDKNSGITKIMSNQKISAIAIGDLTISAVDPGQPFEINMKENCKHCRNPTEKDEKNKLVKCPTADHCNKLNYNCDMLKNNGVNGKITHGDTETYPCARDALLQMIDVFEFKDESEELCNQGKLLNPTILAGCEIDKGTNLKSPLKEEECKTTADSDLGSSDITAVHSAIESTRFEASSEVNEGEVKNLCCGEVEKLETLDTTIVDMPVVDTLDKLLTLVSQLNESFVENNSQICQRSACDKAGAEEKSDEIDYSQASSKSRAENISRAMCVNALEKAEQGSMASRVEDSCTVESHAKSEEQEVTVTMLSDCVSSVSQITKCDEENVSDVKNTRFDDKDENLNHLCTENMCEPDRKFSEKQVEYADVPPQPNDTTDASSGTLVASDNVCKSESDHVAKYECSGETSAVANEFEYRATASNTPSGSSDEESELILKAVLNDLLGQVKILVEGVFEETPQLRCEIVGCAKDEQETTFEEPVQQDKEVQDCLKVEGTGVSKYEASLERLPCIEDVITEQSIASVLERSVQPEEEPSEVVHETESSAEVGDATLPVPVGDELCELAEAWRQEADPGMECSQSSATGMEVEWKENLETAKDSEKPPSDGSTAVQSVGAQTETSASVTGVDSVRENDSVAIASVETQPEQRTDREGNWNDVRTEGEVGNPTDSVLLSDSETIRISLEGKEADGSEQLADGKQAVCVEDEGGLSDEKHFEEDVSPEAQAVKESILSALGLQSLRAARAAAVASETSGYTGTLKTVIKVSRSPDKKSARPPVRVKKCRPEFPGTSADDVLDEHEHDDVDRAERVKYSICSESTSSADINRPASSPEQGVRKLVKLSTCHRSQNDVGTQVLGEKDSVIKNQDDDGKSSGKQDSNLIIPEKSSSFSIHPQRLCSDVCSYCFGKFGSLDTPCHIAQLKSTERQQNILNIETHLTADSCLCDACYRHVDRKANCPSYKPNRKRQHRSDDSHPKSLCCVQECSLPAYHTVRRKWLLKLKRSIATKVPIDMEKTPQHLPFPLCSQHYYWVDFFMVCGVCKRKLSRNHMYPLGSEVDDLNKYLIGDGIPVHLTDKIFLCKLCRYFCTLRLKYKDPSQLSGNHKMFFDSYRKRILHYNDIEVMDSDEVAEPIVMPSKSKRRKTKDKDKDKEGSTDAESVSKAKNKGEAMQSTVANAATDQRQQDVPEVEFISLGDPASDTNRSGASTPLVDYSTLDTSAGTTTINIVTYNPDTSGKSAKHRGAQGAGITVVNKPCYPCSEELPLHASFDFHNRPQDERLARAGEWDKCTATIQFDKQTKKLFQQLQRPYGNHSSFFRHLILLEKYWRSGDLSLSPSASQRAVSYITSVNNRITSFEGHSVPLVAAPPTPPVVASSCNVPVIDLPLRRRPSVGAGGSGSPPVVVTSRGVTFTAVPVSSVPAAGASRVSCTPVLSSMPLVSSPSAAAPLFSSSVPASFLQARHVPNVLQVTAGGKSFSIVPNMMQIKQLQALHRKQQSDKQRQEHRVSGFVPLITDVRSLAADSWDQKNLAKTNTVTLGRQSKMSVTILPKPVQKVAIPPLRPGVKPSTIVTPTGIVLSKTPELSVTAMPVETTVPVLTAMRSGTPGS